MGRNQKKELLKHRITAIACKPYSHMPFCPATVLTKKSLLTRPKARKTRQNCLKECSNELRRKCAVYSPVNCAVSTPQRSHRSTIKQFTQLKWMFDQDMPRNVMAWRMLESQDREVVSASSSQPSWDQPPSIYPNRLIRKYTGHLHHVWCTDGHVQIPASWTVFEKVNWQQDGSFEWGATDSSGEGSPFSSVHSSSNSSRASSDGQSDEGSTFIPPDSHSLHASSEALSLNNVDSQSRTPGHIVFRGESVACPRTREQLNLLAAMVPHLFDWRPQTDERSLLRDKHRHAGYADLNQGAINHDIWPQCSFSSLLSHWTGSCDTLSTVAEVPLPQMLGRLLTSAVETEMFPACCEQPTRWPSSLVKNGTLPIVNYTCRATPESIGWREEMCPLLFAAHFNPSQEHSSYEPNLINWELAETFRPMVTMFILYYLDTRTSTSDPLPSWMVLFGLVYTESGVIVRGHSPCFHPQANGPEDIGEELGWRATSWDVYVPERDALLYPPNDRGPLLFMLNRIQGHCKLVFERLKAWEGYGRACQLLGV